MFEHLSTKWAFAILGFGISRRSSFSLRRIFLGPAAQENVETSNESELVFLIRENNQCVF